jgi:CRISPR-associated protein Cas1
MKDLRLLPKVRDDWSFLYVEHGKIDRDDHAIVLHDKTGVVAIPCATLSTLLLGPGTSITHAAVSVLADNGCLVVWTGEQGVRYYAHGIGETRSAAGLLQQATLWANPSTHLEVVRKMYLMRFDDPLSEGLTIRQIRGKEGARVRDAYARASREWNVPWEGRNYNRSSWDTSNTVNRALSAANSALYHLCHAAIVSAGYSTALGFIHTGNQLSFVYDIGDLYKTEISVPVAFAAAAQGEEDLESRVRRTMRDTITSKRLLQRLVPDLQKLMDITQYPDVSSSDADPASPGALSEPSGETPGGRNFASEEV